MKNTHEKILKLLTKSNAFISGERLGEKLCISRAAVSKSVKELKNRGWNIEAISNLGYKLDKTQDILSGSVIEGEIENLGYHVKVIYHQTIGSTNTWAKENISELPSVAIITSEEQTAGRGRFNRQFYSPKATGVYMSVVIKECEKIKNKNITCIAAIAVKEVIADLLGKEVGIKWVNDIYLEEKKVCGILTEGIMDMESKTLSSVVIGIGLNIATSEFPGDVASIASNVDINQKNSRNCWIASIYCRILKLLENDIVEVMKKYKAASIVLGKEVMVYSGEREIMGKALDIDLEGALTILTKDGTLETFNSGEVSLKKC